MTLSFGMVFWNEFQIFPNIPPTDMIIQKIKIKETEAMFMVEGIIDIWSNFMVSLNNCIPTLNWSNFWSIWILWETFNYNNANSIAFWFKHYSIIGESGIISF